MWLEVLIICVVSTVVGVVLIEIAPYLTGSVLALVQVGRARDAGVYDATKRIP
jgi:hypothetical protein